VSARYLVPLIALAAACGGHASEQPPVSGPAVAVAAAQAHEELLGTIYRASGTVRGRSSVVITSKVSGYVRDVHVRSGDQVAAGQLLVELEANDVRAGVGKDRAELAHAVEARAEAVGAVEAARATAGIAKVSRDRLAKLVDSGAITRQAFDEADAQARGTAAQLAAAEARLRAAGTGIEIAQASLQESQATLDYARVTAPFAGRVIERRVDPGALASPSTPLLVLDGGDTSRVEVPVEESRGATIRIGDPVTVELANQGPINATVGEIVPNVDVASRAFIVKVDLPASAGPLQPGAFARVGFREGTRPRLVVPSTAIDRLGALDRVYVVDHGVARLRMVALGEVQGPWTEVLSGIVPGERIVATVPARLRDGTPVEVTP